jgi:hypothetical protein
MAKKEKQGRWYSASQCERDLRSVDHLYETAPANVITPEIRDKLKMAIWQRLADSVSRSE